jgi:hypothetical protein
MELNPSVSEGIIREVSGEGGTFTIPDEITQELTTNVVVPDRHTIVLGGLFKEETTVSRRQVPILGDIPLIGPAFRGHDDAVRRSEITFLITPTIMEDEILIVEGKRADEDVDLAQLGIRRRLLPWSTDKLTSAHAIAAQAYIDAGDYEMALWEIDRALSLNNNQPLVLKLREEITGEKEQFFNRSLYDDIIRERLNDRLGERRDQHGPRPVREAVVVPDPVAETPEAETRQAEIPEVDTSDAETSTAEYTDEVTFPDDGEEYEIDLIEPVAFDSDAAPNPKPVSAADLFGEDYIPEEYPPLESQHVTYDSYVDFSLDNELVAAEEKPSLEELLENNSLDQLAVTDPGYVDEPSAQADATDEQQADYPEFVEEMVSEETAFFDETADESGG